MYTTGPCTRVFAMALLCAALMASFPKPSAAIPWRGWQSLSTAGFGTSQATADFNGDGKNDVAVLNQTSSFSVYLNQGSGVFPANADLNVTLGVGSGMITAGDYSGDGRADLALLWTSDVSTNSLDIYTSQSTGALFTTPAQSIPFSGLMMSDIHTIDFNVDGKLDIIVLGAGAINIFLNQGSLTFVKTSVVIDSLLQNYVSQIQIADLNSDNKPDVLMVVGQPLNFKLLAYLNDGAGGLGPAQLSTVPAACAAISAVAGAGRINADTNMDAVLLCIGTGGNAGTVWAAPGNNNGTFSTTWLSLAPTGANSLAKSILVADFNHDGFDDVLVNDQFGIGLAWLGYKNGSLSTSLQILLGFWGTLIADFDGDVYPDLCFLQSNEAGVYLSIVPGLNAISPRTHTYVNISTPYELLVVCASDANNNPVAGVPVTFTAPPIYAASSGMAAGTTGSFTVPVDPSAFGTIITGSTVGFWGLVNVAPKSNNYSGTYDISFSSPGYVSQAVFTVTNLNGPTPPSTTTPVQTTTLPVGTATTNQQTTAPSTASSTPTSTTPGGTTPTSSSKITNSGIPTTPQASAAMQQLVGFATLWCVVGVVLVLI